eukprot:12499074-Alexandrium_andersonii.AAC.1
MRPQQLHGAKRPFETVESVVAHVSPPVQSVGACASAATAQYAPSAGFARLKLLQAVLGAFRQLLSLLGAA